MALANYADYKLKMWNPTHAVPVMKNSLTVVAGRPYDMFTVGAISGVAPTTAVAPTDQTVGALTPANGTDLRLVAAQLSSLNPGTFILCDRLSHQGGLSGTTTGAQTTNLPTAALTRHTDGVGVMAGLSIYSAVGTTATTATISYTNQAGTSGQTSPTTVFGSTGFNAANRFIQLPLASGDTGVRAVASVTLAASTVTAGNFGVVLYKPIAAFVIERPGGQVDFSVVDGQGGSTLNQIQSGACLFFLALGQSTTVSLFGNLNLAEV